MSIHSLHLLFLSRGWRGSISWSSRNAPRFKKL